MSTPQSAGRHTEQATWSPIYRLLRDARLKKGEDGNGRDCHSDIPDMREVEPVSIGCHASMPKLRDDFGERNIYFQRLII